MKKKKSFTILDDCVSIEFLEYFGVNTDYEIIRLIEPIIGIDLDLENESIYSYIENLRFEILDDINFEFQCLGFESEPFIDGFGREFGCFVFEDLPLVETRKWCVQIIRKEAYRKIDFRTLSKMLKSI
jgi:hypothetical protein